MYIFIHKYPQKDLHKNVHNTFVYNNLKQKINQISVNGRINK